MELSDKPIIWNYLQTTRAYTETEYDKREFLPGEVLLLILMVQINRISKLCFSNYASLE